jgi:hypothetical protein
MARLTARRLTRLEQRADAARFIRQAFDLAREQRRHVGELVASAQEHRAWFRWDHARHPPPVYPDGRIDLEPSIRRWAMWAGHDPDLAVRDLTAIIERRTAGGPAAEPPPPSQVASSIAPPGADESCG